MSGHRGRTPPSSAGAPRHKGMHQLLLIVAGATLAFVALVQVGVPAMLVVLAAAGWAAAQYDDVYRRAHPAAPVGGSRASAPSRAARGPTTVPSEGIAMEHSDAQRDDDVIIDLRERLAPYDDAAFKAPTDGDAEPEWTPQLEYQRRR